MHKGNTKCIHHRVSMRIKLDNRIKNWKRHTGVSCQALLQEIFPTQGSNPSFLSLLHWQVDSLPLVPPGKPTMLYTRTNIIKHAFTLNYFSWHRHKLKFHLLNLTASSYSLLVCDHGAMAESAVYLSGTDGTMACLIFFCFCFLVCCPDGASGKGSACQCRRHKRQGFNPWVRKMPWRMKWQPTSVFLPGKFHGQRSLIVYGLWGCKESDTI